MEIYINAALVHALPALIAAAETSIDLLVYCMSPLASTTSARQRALHSALQKPTHAGITRRVIIAHHGPLSPMSAANAAAAAQLARAGWIVATYPARPLLHAKMWIFDGSSVIIGSHNLTDAALHTNQEISINVESPETVQRCRYFFDGLWQDAKKE